jgi:hypothetical protein
MWQLATGPDMGMLLVYPGMAFIKLFPEICIPFESTLYTDMVR